MATLYLTDYAFAKLAEIEEYSLEHYPATTEKYMADIEAQINSLRQNPYSGKIYETHSPRYLLHKTPHHFLVYEVIEGDVYVISIEYKSRDLINNLSDLEPYFEEQVKALKKRLKK